MATFDAVYLRVEKVPDDSFFEDLSKKTRIFNVLTFGDPIIARWTEGMPWIQIQGVDDPDSSQLGQRLSQQYMTDSIVFCVQTVVDAFAYWHFRNGRELRCLIFGCKKEGCWETARGEPDDWEDAILFNQEDFNRYYKDDGSERFKEARKIFEGKKIVLGKSYPRFSVLEIGQRLGLPGFDYSKPWSIECELPR